MTLSWVWILALGFAPGLAIMLYIFWKDRLNREPLHLLFLCFLAGVMAIIPAILLEIAFGKIFPDLASGNFLQIAIHAFIGIGLIEEFTKFYTLKKAVWKSAYFDEPFDGITYSVMVAMGFATAENIAYIWKANISGAGMATATLRAFTAVPAHASFGILIGYFLGFARFKPDHSGIYQFAALFFATLFHGAYDFFLFTQEMTGTILGAIISLVTGIYFSRKAIQIHGNKKEQWFLDEQKEN